MTAKAGSKKAIVLTLIAITLLMLGAAAATAAEQRAFRPSYENYATDITMYEKPDKTSKSWTATIPTDGVAVPSAMRDKAGDLWYKATIDGRTGWMHYVGIRLQMGSKSKLATAAFKKFEAMTDAILNGKDKSWSDVGATGGSDKTFNRASRGGSDESDIDEINTIHTPKGYRASQLRASDGRTCKQVLGFDPIGMKMDALRAKLGTPTARETPEDSPQVTILTYEATEGNNNLEVFLKHDKVVRISMY